MTKNFSLSLSLSLSLSMSMSMSIFISINILFVVMGSFGVVSFICFGIGSFVAFRGVATGMEYEPSQVRSWLR